MEYATLLNMDRQGRIVIPIQVRKALKLEEGDLLALEANEKNILLRKQTAYIPLDAGLKEFLDILHANVPSRILLCNETKILAVKNYHAALNMPVTETIRAAVVYNVLVFTDPDTRYLFAVYNKSWVRTVSGSVDHVAHFKLRHVNHNGRDSLVVIDQLVVRCYHFQGKFC